jgi:hypothetical protein
VRVLVREDLPELQEGRGGSSKCCDVDRDEPSTSRSHHHKVIEYRKAAVSATDKSQAGIARACFHIQVRRNSEDAPPPSPRPSGHVAPHSPGVHAEPERQEQRGRDPFVGP